MIEPVGGLGLNLVSAAGLVPVLALAETAGLARLAPSSSRCQRIGANAGLKVRGDVRPSVKRISPPVSSMPSTRCRRRSTSELITLSTSDP